MKYKLVQISYLLGISLLLASVFYFFASNWQGFERGSKVILSIMIMVVFYGASFLLTRLIQHQSFLSKWLFVAGSISFGLSVALIGQLYNSHAESYQLFLIWLIPVLLFSFFTKYVPMYVLSYLLLHITIYFYVNPQAYYVHWNESQKLLIILGVAALNVLLSNSYQFLHSSFIKYTAFTVFHVLMIFSAVSSDFPTYGVWMNLIYIVILIYGFFRYYKGEQNKNMFVLYWFTGTAYIIIKGFELVSNYYGELIFVFLLGVAILLLIGSIKLLQIINIHSSSKMVKTIIVVAVTFISSIFATTAIMGLLSLLFQDMPMIILFGLGILFIGIGFISKRQETIRYTLLCTGYLIATGASTVDDNIILKIILIGILAYALIKIEAKGMNAFYFTLLNIIVFSLIVKWVTMIDWMFILFIILNGGYYILRKKDKISRILAFLFSLGFFSCLTMVNQANMINLFYNISFFVSVTLLLFWTKRTDRAYEFGISISFWFLFIGYKYYDIAWTLVHKSIIFFVLGVLFIVASVFAERIYFTIKKESSFISLKWLPILIVIILQFGFVTYQAKSNETLLEKGKTVTLTLIPVDPRSLFQGDYVSLRYDISTIPGLEKLEYPKGLIKVVLRKSLVGVYEYSGFYQYRGKWNRTYEADSNDVVMNGSLSGTTEIVYGIENYFVQEGTGTKLQNQAKYAKVKIGKNGNAILEKVY